jgi:hypothetical protein
MWLLLDTEGARLVEVQAGREPRQKVKRKVRAWLERARRAPHAVRRC